jgi:hypothetical protein
MTSRGRPTGKRAKPKSVRRPPPHWRKYLTQAELELPPPVEGASVTEQNSGSGEFQYADPPELAWWQSRLVVAGLAATCAALLIATGIALLNASRDREAARVAAAREQVLTLRAINSVRALRVAPNPRSWSAVPDASIAWPEPPQLLELQLPVGYADYLTFALTVDKVDHGRVLIIERMAPDSNKELHLSLNSSAFGPGEYRLRLQGRTWRGERVDAGWVRLLIRAPD